MTDVTAELPRGRRIRRRVFRFVERCLALIGLLFVIYHVCFDLDIVSSPSMSPTLQGMGANGGDYVLTENVSYWFRNPRRWEVVRFLHRDGFFVAKRVVALPGETIGVVDGKVTIDGEVSPYPDSINHLKYRAYGVIGRDRTYLSKDGYFLLGDDSVDSQDSRYEKELPGDEILGRAWLIVWPPERMGFVNP